MCEDNKTTGACSTHTTSMHNPPHNHHNRTHNPPIISSLPSASNWECACASFNKGGKSCPMCATPHPKRQALLAALTADVAVNAAVVAAPAAMAKAILSALWWSFHVAAAAAAVQPLLPPPPPPLHCCRRAAAKLPPPLLLPSFSSLLSSLSLLPFP